MLPAKHPSHSTQHHMGQSRKPSSMASLTPEVPLLFRVWEKILETTVRIQDLDTALCRFRDHATAIICSLHTCVALTELSGSSLSSARISANKSLSSGRRQTNKAALYHKHLVMTKGLRQQGITSVIATVYSGSQLGVNSLEISASPIERAMYLQDAAGKSPSLRTRRRTERSPHQLQRSSRH